MAKTRDGLLSLRADAFLLVIRVSAFDLDYLFHCAATSFFHSQPQLFNPIHTIGLLIIWVYSSLSNILCFIGLKLSPFTSYQVLAYITRMVQICDLPDIRSLLSYLSHWAYDNICSVFQIRSCYSIRVMK